MKWRLHHGLFFRPVETKNWAITRLLALACWFSASVALPGINDLGIHEDVPLILRRGIAQNMSPNIWHFTDELSHSVAGVEVAARCDCNPIRQKKESTMWGIVNYFDLCDYDCAAPKLLSCSHQKAEWRSGTTRVCSMLPQTRQLQRQSEWATKDMSNQAPEQHTLRRTG